MKVPDGYTLLRVLSPGPLVAVAQAAGPDGRPCVIKAAAIARGVLAVEREAAVLKALRRTRVAGVPGLLGEGSGFIVLEWLDLPTLRQQEEQFRGDPLFRNRVARAAFERLAAVHEAADEQGPLQVVHGDLSPDNLYVSCEPCQTVIADFAMASMRDDPPRASGGMFRGTLLYVAPEVARSEPFGAQADDFALAASILHVATGVPLRHGSATAVVLADAGTRPLDASHPWRREASNLFDRAVADALLACLAFDPGDRPRATPRPC